SIAPTSISTTSLTLNSNLYIFNAQNYTWVNTFDVSDVNGFVSKHPPELVETISLGAKIGIGIGVVAAVGIIAAVVGFFLYKKFRNSVATPGTQYI
ncbi:3669_t:CDS:1, partial [Gigaspora rosea]